MTTEEERLRIENKANQLGLSLRVLVIAAVEAFDPQREVDRVEALSRRVTAIETHLGILP